MKALLAATGLAVVLAAGCGGDDTTARSSGIPFATTTTTFSSGVAATKVLSGCATAQERPAEITIACADGNIVATAIEWTAWAAAGAEGRATMQVNPCNPYCAADTQRPFPADVRLDKPAGGLFTELVVTWNRESPTGNATDAYELPTTPIPR
ncbi:MAG: hypothetical protein JWO68_1747 [Actinomycetia bacterium]|nr:hypothetical protein [Actinomycetes bacterium]